MTKIPKEFKEIHTLDGLKRYLDKTKAKDIGILGGRKFVHGDSKGELTLNHIVRKFGFIVGQFSDADASQHTIADNIKYINKKIKNLDNNATEKVLRKGWFARLLTAIRKNDVVIAIGFIEIKQHSREDIIKKINRFNTDLTEIRKAKAADVGKLFDDSFKVYSDTAQKAREALVDFVKLDNDKNAENLKNAVEELLKIDRYSMKLEELIYKFLTDVDTNLFLPLAKFIFQLYTSAKQLDVNTDKSSFKCMSLRNAPEFNNLHTKDKSRPKLYIYKSSDIPTDLKYLDGSINPKRSERNW